MGSVFFFKYWLAQQARVFWLSTGLPNGFGGLSVFKYCLAHGGVGLGTGPPNGSVRFWLSTGLPNGRGSFFNGSPNGSGGVSFFNGLPNGPGGFVFQWFAQRAWRGFVFQWSAQRVWRGFRFSVVRPTSQISTCGGTPTR